MKRNEIVEYVFEFGALLLNNEPIIKVSKSFAVTEWFVSTVELNYK